MPWKSDQEREEQGIKKQKIEAKEKDKRDKKQSNLFNFITGGNRPPVPAPKTSQSAKEEDKEEEKDENSSMVIKLKEVQNAKLTRYCKSGGV